MTRWTLTVALLCLVGCKCAAGNLKTHIGYLEIAPYTAGKDTRAVTVHCPDGERVVIDVHYDKKYLEYVNKRVVIEGGPPPPPEDERAQAAIYFQVSEMELAPGEQPWDPPPERVPAPPVVTSRKDIDSLVGAWGLAMGKPTFTFEPPLTTPADFHTLNMVEITLADGTKLSQHPYRAIHKTNIGKYTAAAQATILFETTTEKKIVSAKACLGRALRCGVED